MNHVVLIYWIIIATTVIYSNYMFFKKLKNIQTKHLAHTSIYFLMSIISPVLIMLFFMLVVKSPRLIQILNLKIDYYDYPFRIIYGCVVFPLGFFANIYFAKFYLKRISKTKNEIELIGKE
jgi:hypothetical protein